MFTLLGVLLALYVVCSIARGEVFAKRGPWGCSYRREDRPVRFWSTIGVHILLTAARLFDF